MRKLKICTERGRVVPITVPEGAGCPELERGDEVVVMGYLQKGQVVATEVAAEENYRRRHTQ